MTLEHRAVVPAILKPDLSPSRLRRPGVRIRLRVNSAIVSEPNSARSNFIKILNLNNRTIMLQLTTLRKWMLFAAIAPATAILPFLWAPIPGGYHGHREVAGYFQALAYWRDPVGQFFYNTPAENLSSIHFHSFLSAPFVGVGFPQGGRAMSLLAAVFATITVAYITAIVVSTRVAPVAAAALWAHPLFINFAGAFMPETVSILLTSGSILLFLLGYQKEYSIFVAGSVIILIPAISTHLWEASILLPLVILAAYHRQWKVATIFPIVGGGVIAANWHLTNLQPSSPRSLIRRYALWQDPAVLLSAENFWLETATPDLVSLGNILVLTLIGATILCIGLLIRGVQTGNRTPILLSTWLASGLSIPILLANGYLWHNYYLWAILAPLAVSIAAGIEVLIPRLQTVINSFPAPRQKSFIIMFVTVSLIWSLTFQLGVLAGTGVPVLDQRGVIESQGGVDYQTLVDAGKAVGEANVENQSMIVFVGDWGRRNSNHFGQFPRMSTVLICSGLNIRTRGPSNVRPWFSSGGPRYYQNRSEVSECEILVVKNGSQVSTESCL
jgi:hypothetical protein